MAHFARVKNGVVTSVIVIEQNVLDDKGGWVCPETGEFAPTSEWVQTSYNTHEGIHDLGGTPLRKNFAGKGYLFDETLDAFIPPKPFESWSLDEIKGQWKAPKEMPVVDLETNNIVWDEVTKDWQSTTRSEVTNEII
jgi:hypothetical protein